MNKETFDLQKSVNHFINTGYCPIPTGCADVFKSSIESLGLNYKTPTVDMHWKCWIFQKGV